MQAKWLAYCKGVWRNKSVLGTVKSCAWLSLNRFGSWKMIWSGSNHEGSCKSCQAVWTLCFGNGKALLDFKQVTEWSRIIEPGKMFLYLFVLLFLRAPRVLGLTIVIVLCVCKWLVPIMIFHNDWTDRNFKHNTENWNVSKM